jgi:5-methylcytosine-specific restriction endonuclease McrA
MTEEEKEKRRIRDRAYENRPAVKARRKAARQLLKVTDPEKACRTTRTYRKRHPDRILAYKRKRRENNPEKVNQERRDWGRKNRAKVAIYNVQSKLKRQGIHLGPIDYAKWEETLKAFDYKCLYCRNSYECLDHVVPVTKGGTNHHTNCVPACNRCNTSKGNRDLLYWLTHYKIPKEGLSRPYDWEPPLKSSNLIPTVHSATIT